MTNKNNTNLDEPYDKGFLLFFEENKAKYFEVALKDYREHLNSKNGKYVVKIKINPDDDFDLDILDPKVKNNAKYVLDENGYVCVYANDKEELINKTIDVLENAKFTYIGTWTIIRGNVREEGDYSRSWKTIKEQAIAALLNGETKIRFGGNQTIQLSLEESAPFADSKNKKRLKL